MRTITNSEIDTRVTDLATFVANSAHGVWQRADEITFGKLSPTYSALLRSDVAKSGRVFVVYSYQTPIAWAFYGHGKSTPTVVMPDVRYSVTTTKLQNKVRAAFRAIPGVDMVCE